MPVPEIEDSVANGTTLSGVRLPTEILLQIFLSTDRKTLLSCQRVCKHWRQLVQSDTWRDKAELTSSDQFVDGRPWQVYYLICARQPFGRNLLKNHSGRDGFKNWTITSASKDEWRVENPPRQAPDLPVDEENVFEGENYCFATSWDECTKWQTVDLLREGFTENVLDRLRPSIRIGEWYCSRRDCAGIYILHVKLLGERSKKIKFFTYQEIMDDYSGWNRWHKFSTEISNYGPGLRYIQFVHSGRRRSGMAFYGGSKIAGASVEFLMPEFRG